MSRLKPLLNVLALCLWFFGYLLIYNFFTPDYSKKECEVIRKNFEQIKIGMSKEEVLLLINDEPNSKVYRYPEFFPEQKTEWEIWMLCADLSSCIITSSGREQCYEWQMVAFDSQTQKVVKVFSDDPERVGFA